MRQDTPHNTPNRPTMAYADGELDANASMRLVEQMAEEPLTAKAVLYQQQLRTAVGRAMTDPALTVPESLRSALQDLAASTPGQAESEAQEPSQPAVIGRIGFWVPAAVAAVLLIGLLVAIPLMNSPAGPDYGGYAFAPSLLTPAQVGHFSNRHIVCSVSPDALMRDPDLPKVITELPEALRQQFGAAPVGLDLSSLGYEFAGAGPCSVPGSGSVHIVYQPMAGFGHTGPISLWVRPSNPDLEIESDQVFQVSPEDQDQPILVWRSGGIDYWIVGNSPDDTHQVARQITQRT